MRTDKNWSKLAVLSSKSGRMGDSLGQRSTEKKKLPGTTLSSHNKRRKKEGGPVEGFFF